MNSKEGFGVFFFFFFFAFESLFGFPFSLRL